MSVKVFHRLDPDLADGKGQVASHVRKLLEIRPDVQSIIVSSIPFSRNGYRYVRSPATSDLLYYCLNVGTNHRGRRISPVRLQRAEFTGSMALLEALQFANKRILPTRHAYVIHLRDCHPAEAFGSISLQIVDRHRIRGNGDTGMMAHFTFDLGCDRLDPLVRLLGSGRLGDFEEYRVGGVACYGLELSGEPGRIATMLGDLLEEFDGRRPSENATVDVHDDGPPKAMGDYIVVNSSGDMCRAVVRPQVRIFRDRTH